jgi:aldehyde dehydrogenase family 7 protein A1
MPDADLSLAVPAVFFGSVGTTGQRCTSTRRLYLHRAIAPEFLARLQTLYASPALYPGDPLDARTLLGPLHSRGALDIFDGAVAELNAAGAQIIFSGSNSSNNSVSSGRYADLASPLDGGNFVRPTIALMPTHPTSNSKFKSKSKAAMSEPESDALGADAACGAVVDEGALRARGVRRRVRGARRGDRVE